MLSRLLRAAGATLVALATLFAAPAFANIRTVNGISVETSLTQITRGTAYSYQITPSGPSGYSGAYTFSVIGGTLPVGMSVSSSGLVSGVTCGANGSYKFDLRVTAGATTADFTGSNDFSINVTTGGSGECALSIGGVAPTGYVGSAYSGSFSASGGPGPFTFTITGGTLPPGVTMSSGGVLSGTPTTAGTYTFFVRGANASGAGTSQFSITILPAPTIVVNPATIPAGQTTVAYSQTFTASGGTSPYSFAISAGALPSGMTLAAGGALTGTPVAAGTYNFTVRATDASSFTGTRAYALTIAGSNTLTLSPTTIPNGVRGTAYNQTITASGGTAPYAWSLSSGTLPAGLTINGTTGAITGTPTTLGTSNFTVRAVDANGNFGTRAYSVVIGAATINIAPATLPDAQNGVAYSQSIAGSGGTAPYTFTLQGGSTLPPGLALAANGTLSGTTTSAGSFNFTVVATDSFGDTGTRAYSMTVTAANIVLSPSSLANVTAGTPVNTTFTATGGTGPYTYASSGTLPPGVALSGDTLSGTPTTPGTYTFDITVTDANGDTKTVSYSFTIVAVPVSITTPSLPNAKNGMAYSVGLTATGGVGTLTWSNVGALPNSLVLAADGTLSGTPATAAGSYTVDVSVTDGVTTDTRSYTLVVDPASMGIAPAFLPDGTTGVAYSQQLFTTGGASPYAYTQTGGSLPPGLTLSNGGLIAGTPAAQGTFNFDVTATDQNGDTAVKSYSITIAYPTVTVDPATLPGGTNSVAYSATFTANGGTAPYNYHVSAGATPNGLTLAGGTLSGTPTAAGTYNFTITATDPYGASGSTAYSVTIAAATLVVSPSTLPDATNGSAYNQALSTSGGTAPYTYTSTALPSGLVLSAGGVISGTPNVAAGPYSFDVTVTDANGDTTTVTYSLTVNAATITVDPATLPGGANSAAYSATFTANGGTGPYTYVATGSLPTGLSFAGDTLSGTPTASGSYNFTITATDANGDTGSNNYTVAIGAATLTIAPATLPNATNGTAYSQTLSTSGGTAPYTYSSTALPSGLVLSAGGVISGTPNVAAGPYNFDVTSTDANGDNVTVTYSLTVNGATINVDPATVPKGTNSTAYSATFTATGGTGPYTYVATGSLPTGLSFAGDTLSGTPTASGSYNFTITATDANGDSGANTYTVTIASATLTIAPATLPNATNGSAYSQALSTSGGTAPYTYTSTALPSGLVLSAGGVISGTPNVAAGAYNFDVTSTDANGDNVTVTYSLTIGSATITVTPAALANCTNSTAYAAAFSATGGTGTYTYAITAGALPAGLSLSGDSLTGTPTAAGTYNFTVTATDTNSDSGARAYTLVVDPADIAISPGTLPNATNGAAYSQAMAASGGTGPYTFTIASGALPTGVSLSAAGVIAGTPGVAVGTFNFDVTATDANGDNHTQSFALVVGAATIAVTPATLPNAANGTAYSQDLAATGGTGPYTYSVVAGTLPTGLALVNGKIAGTPTTAGTFDFTIRATDANGDMGTQAYTVATAGSALLTVNPETLPGATVQDAYVQQLTALGGTGYSFAITAGALPQGLAMGTDGRIDGTPTTAGQATFTVTVTDANGNFGTRIYTLVVAESIVLDITPGTLEEGNDGSPYEANFGATGGTAPYTFDIAGGTLPPGMTLADDGTLSGTPTATGSYTFTVRGEDAAGHVGTRSFTLVIGAALLPDPTRDPSVIDNVNEQLNAARRMGEMQMSHVFRRLDGPRTCTRTEEASSDACKTPVEVWATGTRETSWASGTSVLNAFTVGADMQAGPVRVGAALGTGMDLVERASGYRGDADGKTFMLYGRIALGETFGLSAVAGRTNVDIDSRRAMGDAGTVVGRRDGDTDFVGVEVSGEWGNGQRGLVPYLRYEHARTELDGYAESATSTRALQFGSMSQRNSAFVLGAEAFHVLRFDWGTLTPKVRVEWRDRNGSNATQSMWYLDEPATPYFLGVNGVDDRSALAALGLEAAFGGVRLTFEYGSAGSADDMFEGQAVRLQIRADF